MMATAGFEWQYDLSKGQGKEKAEEGIERENLHEFSEQEKEILAFLEEKIESHTGEKKRYFKGIRNLVKRSSIKLSDKIEWTLIKYSDVLEGLIKNIYNTEKISFKEIAVRIARYRNKIAHGDISESHKDIVFDLRVIELLYYVMVLDYIGVSKEKNLKALSSVGL